MNRFETWGSRPIPVLLAAVLVVSVSLGGAFLAEAQTAKSNKERVIKVVAKKFAYTPNEIVLQKGQKVVLEFTSVDFVHGFKIPDMNLRADLPPGKVTRVAISADTVGVYDFLCDNFCGSEHEEMNGRIVVQE
jgi:cytochrome c oxidase subunit II